MYRSIAIAIARYICTAVLNLLNFITIDWYNNCRYYFNYYATNNSDTIYVINRINSILEYNNVPLCAHNILFIMAWQRRCSPRV